LEKNPFSISDWLARIYPGILIGGRKNKQTLTLLLSPDSILRRQEGRRSCFSLSVVVLAEDEGEATRMAEVVTVVVAVEPEI
jgi:hypothetical protein